MRARSPLQVLILSVAHFLDFRNKQTKQSKAGRGWHRPHDDHLSSTAQFEGVDEEVCVVLEGRWGTVHLGRDTNTTGAPLSQVLTSGLAHCPSMLGSCIDTDRGARTDETEHQ